MKRILNLKINGKNYEILSSDNRTLLEVLREDLNLTGTKWGCDTGECGACVVLIDGIPQLSCLTLAVFCEGKEITTVEGIPEKEMEEIEKILTEEGAVQCGFCTPGMVIMMKYLKDCGFNNSLDIKEELSGNFCRCTGYKKILDACIKILNKHAK